MPGNKRRYKRKSVDLNTSGIKTRRQRQKIKNKKNDQNNNNKMAKPSVDTLLTFIPVFDGKKESNINFFVSEFNNLMEEVDLDDKSKLAILKAKLVGQAREKLANDESLNTEKDFAKFKEKLIDIFSAKTNFSTAQNNFFALRQKPTQSITDFIYEFNAAAKLYADKSGQKIENSNNKLFETIKFTRFLESMRPDLSLDVRRMAPANFNDACKFAKQMEEAYNQVSLNEINTIQKSSNDENFDKLLKLNIESAEQIKILTSELNNLKLKSKENIENKNNWCEYCKRKSHSIETCWFRNSTKNSQQRNENPSGQNSKNRYFYNNKFQQRPNFSPRYTNPNQNMQFQNYAMPGGYYGFPPYFPPPPNYFSNAWPHNHQLQNYGQTAETSYDNTRNNSQRNRTDQQQNDKKNNKEYQNSNHKQRRGSKK